MKAASIFAILTVLATPALAETVAEKTGVNFTLRIAPTTADFVHEAEYHSDQDAGHKDAVSLFTRFAKGGENPELKAWATKTLPDLQGYLKMAQDLDK